MSCARVLVPIALFASAVFACGRIVTVNIPASCSGSATQSASSGVITSTSNNVVPVYIADPSTTGSVYYLNEPVVSVTICSPNHSSTSQCQTISNILLDTGSTGLRVFGSVLGSNVSLAQQTVSVSGATYDLAECEVFGIGADWGSVENADVQLGNQTATNIPIQVINIGFESIPSYCKAQNPDTTPCAAGYNGILGVGLFAQDCGSDCASSSEALNPGTYYACDSTGCYNGTCSGSNCALAIATNQQVSNPISSFGSGYNNGLSITLPGLSSGGASGVSGTMTLGIGSSAGNSPGSGVTVYGAAPLSDGYWEDFRTVYNGTTYGTSSSQLSFIDSGSNCYFFPSKSGLTRCTDTGFFCSGSVGSPQSLSATIEGFSGSPSTGSFAFNIVSADALVNTGHSAFSTLAAPSSSEFDWGLPFFYGKTIYFGIDGQTASFNGTTETGPYWAF